MKNLKHLFTALLLLCATVANAHDFEVGGIYYNILSEEDKTVEVTRGANQYTGSVVIPETVTVSETGTNVLKTFDAWTSTNKSNSTTSQTSYTLNVAAGNILKFDWSVSSESNFDWLTITLDGTEIVKKSGTDSGSYEKTFDTAGSHTLVVKYTKDSSQSSGNDEGKIYNITLSAVGSVNDVVYRVTSIGGYAFYSYKGLTSITIPNSVTSIGEWAFSGCTSLKIVYNNSSLDITAGSSNHGFVGNYAAVVVNKKDILEKVGNFTFHKTDSTVTLVDYTGVDNAISLPASYNGENYAIGRKLFFEKSNIDSVFIPNSVTSIGGQAFYRCTGLTSITIPNSVTSIGSEAFGGCSGLTSIVIPNSVTSIGNYAFSGCSSFSLTLGNGVKYYGMALASCYPAEIYINDLAVFCESDFHEENDLLRAPLYLNGELITDLIIPDGVTRIGVGVFRSSRFTSVEIPNSVTSIGDRAFYYSGLTSITIPNSVTSIGRYAFDGTAWYNNQPDGVVYAGKVLYKYKGEMPSNTSVTVKDGTLGIADYAFYDCSGLTSVTIPNSVTSIGSEAFDGTAWYNNQPDGVVYAGKVLYDYKGTMPSNTSITIKDGTLSIADYAFDYSTGLTSITIPNSVTSIGEYAFCKCSGLTSVTSLIPADELFAINSDVFYNVNKTSCTLYVPYGEKETYAATEGWNEFTNIVELEPTATEVTVTIGQYGSLTFCSEYALDFSQVDGLKAYAATGYKSNSQVVTLTRVQTAEAGIGLFLKGEPGEYIVPVIESTDEHSLNMLVGTLEQTTVNSTDGAMSNYKFTIAEGDTAPMFYPFEDNTTFSAGKAYLQIPTAWLPATAQKSLSARFDDGETTDIDELKGESGEVKTIYDLQGRVVENPTSGIYIIDGKKVIIK